MGESIPGTDQNYTIWSMLVAKGHNLPILTNLRKLCPITLLPN